MDTKLKADISEHVVIARLLEQGAHVLRPIGDRLPYDLVVEYRGRFIKIQVKRAWLRGKAYIVDSRRTKTNRRRMLRKPYQCGDFDYAIVHIPDGKIVYIMPILEFLSYRSEITFIENSSRQRRPRSWKFREAWHLLQNSNQ